MGFAISNLPSAARPSYRNLLDDPATRCIPRIMIGSARRFGAMLLCLSKRHGRLMANPHQWFARRRSRCYEGIFSDQVVTCARDYFANFPSN
jgi:hypothetical protein